MGFVVNSVALGHVFPRHYHATNVAYPYLISLPQTLHWERASFPELQQRGRGAGQPYPRIAFISFCRVTFTITFTYLNN
jgi:hypothetical protein